MPQFVEPGRRMRQLWGPLEVHRSGTCTDGVRHDVLFSKNKSYFYLRHCLEYCLPRNTVRAAPKQQLLSFLPVAPAPAPAGPRCPGWPLQARQPGTPKAV